MATSTFFPHNSADFSSSCPSKIGMGLVAGIGTVSDLTGLMDVMSCRPCRPSWLFQAVSGQWFRRISNTWASWIFSKMDGKYQHIPQASFLHNLHGCEQWNKNTVKINGSSSFLPRNVRENLGFLGVLGVPSPNFRTVSDRSTDPDELSTLPGLVLACSGTYIGQRYWGLRWLGEPGGRLAGWCLVSNNLW